MLKPGKASLSAFTDLVTILNLCSCCCVAIIVLRLFLVVPWVGLSPVMVALGGHTHLLIESIQNGIIYDKMGKNDTNLL